MALSGATFNPRAKRWQARATVDGVRKHIGYFETEQEAHEAFLAARGDNPEKIRGPKPVATVEKAMFAAVDRIRDYELIPFEFMDRYDWIGPFEHFFVQQAARLSRLHNVSAWYMMFIALCPGEEDVVYQRLQADPMSDQVHATDEIIAVRLDMVRRLDLWAHLPDIAKQCVGGRVSFEDAVGRLLDIA